LTARHPGRPSAQPPDLSSPQPPDPTSAQPPEAVLVGGRAVQVAVCGPSSCTAAETADARRVGELLAQRGAVVICGGGGGVMAAATAGARAAGGTVVGVLPGRSSEGAAPGLSAAVITGMGEARNAIIVQSADAVITVGGSWGTLSEVALAMRGGVPVVSLPGWHVTDADGTPVTGILHATTPEEAVTAALSG
jgi:uncharacterized protein (TIGR00725 family)